MRRRSVKLDELIRAVEGAHNALLDLEELDEKELHRIRADYTRLARRARLSITQGGVDTDAPELK
jgi:low affinity Fe/Cu permease